MTEHATLKDLIEVWKKTVEVQQHFNDLQLKIRNLAITVVAAIVGASGIALARKYHLLLFGLDLPAAAFLQGTALISWAAFYFMDRFWYYRLLLAAVNHGINIEKTIGAKLPEVQLATHISKEIPAKHTTRVINIYYAVGAIGIIVLILITADLA